MKVTKRNITILTGNIIWAMFVFGVIYLFADWASDAAYDWVGESQIHNPFMWILFVGTPAVAWTLVHTTANYYSKGFLYLLNKVLPK